MSRSSRSALAVLFAASGGTALVYEIVWTRLLGLLVGHTTYGLTTVLVAFMAGLGLGGWLGGRLVARRLHPLRVYALLEIGIAAAGAVLGPVLYALEPVFGWAYRAAPESTLILTALRLALCGAVMLVPTVLMGMTLPVLSALVADREGRVGGDVGILYAANTLGAALGSLACGFVLVPALGMTRTVLTAVAANIAIAAIALLLSTRIDAPGRPARDEARPAIRGRTAAGGSLPGPGRAGSAGAAAALGALAVSAACAMALQVAWVRALGLAIGSTTYAFTLIVSTFILGLALGAAAFGRLADRVARPSALLAACLGGAGLSSLLILPLLGRFPVWVAEIMRIAEGDHRRVLLAEGLGVFVLFVVPTVFIGGAFPVVVRIVTPALERVGRSVGDAYAASTGGSILGTTLAGFVLVPALGARATAIAAGATSLAAGLLVLASSPRPGSSPAPVRRAAVAAVGLTACGVLIWALPGWHPGVVNSGAYVNSHRILTESARNGIPVREVMERLPLLWWREGIDDTVAVGRGPDGDLFLAVNGKPDASGEGDAVTELMLAHLPLALHPDPRSALVIGFGSGLTTGAAARHDLERIDAAEISDGVVEAARRWFAEINGNVLDDPRVRLVMGDARMTVGYGRGTYDVITSQPSNLYMAGVPELFTVEFFEICRRRLAPGGVMCQWIHTYNLSLEDLRLVVRTFAEVFPGVSLWDAQLGSDLLLIGTNDSGGAPRVDFERLEGLFDDPGIAGDLARIGTNDPAGFLGSYVAEGATVRAFAGDGPVNTVNRNILEFSVPRSMQIGAGLEVFHAMDSLRVPSAFDWLVGDVPGGAVERANRRRRDTRLFARVSSQLLQGNREAALAAYEEIAPSDGPLAWRRARRQLIDATWNAYAGGAHREALRLARTLSQGDPDDPEPLQLLAASAAAMDRPRVARRALERLLESRADERTLAWARENLTRIGGAETPGRTE